jgi:hypothetical protein
MIFLFAYDCEQVKKAFLNAFFTFDIIDILCNPLMDIYATLFARNDFSKTNVPKGERRF